ncbi:hypothetical protein [Burkholderia ubonensis]|uniref:hypothetical protein n=1 Tax=Burkholderia ubonensis TaxID=101571 RepID=UPI000BA5DCAD|nr:hypothetical protein [Burkholderia ubonensis]PAK12429.1 hypothetical protein CJO66_22900 [Burkholderia ubonensis]RQP28895.1 hypothetical protein DF155_25985 [Burkholderia ubonensis]RQP31821.1 hypothetical protein DF154_28245 [Burkholderia ubonensis]RQP34329.1 hypothetical protein DF156_26785 [Burkholderia ubonensis]RQP49373.1 hypothetical protein DF144_24940 [Burkholderia ubonensis]
MYLTEKLSPAHATGRRAARVPLPSGKQLERQIRTTVRTADVLLRQAIRVPERHEWQVDTDCLNAAGGPLAAWDSCVTFRVLKVCDAAAQCDDSGRFAIEIRLLLPEQAYLAGQRVGTFGRHHGCGFGASVSVTSELPQAGQHVELVAAPARRVQGATLEGLIDTIASAVNAALRAAGHAPPA